MRYIKEKQQQKFTYISRQGGQECLAFKQITQKLYKSEMEVKAPVQDLFF